MTGNDLLEYIFDRLGRSSADEMVFGESEIEDWPPGALDRLIHLGLCRPAQAARAINCTGCEENCPMPVHVLPRDGIRPAKAFISCDKRDDIGRVMVDLNQLKQWKITASLLAMKISELLGLNKTPKELVGSRRWVLGLLKGKEYKAQIALAIENGASLQIATHAVSLVEVLSFDNGHLMLDQAEILRWVNKPASADTSTRKPSKIRQESRKLKTQEMYDAWQRSYRDLKAKNPHKGDIWCSLKIEKSPIAQGRNSETIRKHMKK